jgi:hypothetical protein
MEPYQSYMLPGNHLPDPRSFIDSASDRRSPCEDEGVDSNFMIGMSAGGGTRLRTMIGILGAPARVSVFAGAFLTPARRPRTAIGSEGVILHRVARMDHPSCLHRSGSSGVHHRVLRGVREQAI